MSKLFETLSFSHGPGMKNRFMLAPLTNSQSRPDGILTDDEYKWLTMRAVDFNTIESRFLASQSA